MARRIRTDPPPVSRDLECQHRARAVSFRLRMALMGIDDRGGAFTRERARADALAEPSERLAALLDLADAIRPHCTPGVVQHTLPDTAWHRRGAS